MSHLIRCRTLFDITATGTRGGFRSLQPGQRDDSGRVITNLDQWHRSRNQQRNWETLNQIISLRCLPHEIQRPRRDQDTWEFFFRVDSLAALSNEQVLGALINDCANVPMILGLDERPGLTPFLLGQGSETNVWFEEIGK
jgi:hypothetical protein